MAVATLYGSEFANLPPGIRDPKSKFAALAPQFIQAHSSNRGFATPYDFPSLSSMAGGLPSSFSMAGGLPGSVASDTGYMAGGLPFEYGSPSPGFGAGGLPRVTGPLPGFLSSDITPGQYSRIANTQVSRQAPAWYGPDTLASDPTKGPFSSLFNYADYALRSGNPELAEFYRKQAVDQSLGFFGASDAKAEPSWFTSRAEDAKTFAVPPRAPTPPGLDFGGFTQDTSTDPLNASFVKAQQAGPFTENMRAIFKPPNPRDQPGGLGYLSSRGIYSNEASDAFSASQQFSPPKVTGSANLRGAGAALQIGAEVPSVPVPASPTRSTGAVQVGSGGGGSANINPPTGPVQIGPLPPAPPAPSPVPTPAPSAREVREAIAPTATSTVRHPAPAISAQQIQEEINRLKAMSAATQAARYTKRQQQAEKLGFSRESPAFQGGLRGY